MRDGTIGKDDFLLQHVVDGLAVEDGARAARIVRHHAADGGAAGGRNVGCEAKTVRTQCGVEFIEHDAWLDAHPAFFHIEFENPVVIFRGVDLQARADRLTGLRGAAAAQCDAGSGISRKAAPR